MPPKPTQNTPLNKGSNVSSMDAERLRRSEQAGAAAASFDSDESALLTEALQIIDKASDIDEARVEAIRQQIAKGEFKIDYEQLAKKMIAFESSLD